MPIVCSRPECQTTEACAHRGPNGQFCWFVSPIAPRYETWQGGGAEITDEMIAAFTKAADGIGAEKGSFLWEQTRDGLKAAMLASSPADRDTGGGKL